MAASLAAQVFNPECFWIDGLFLGELYLCCRYWVEWVFTIIIIMTTLYISAVAEPRHRLTPMPDGFLDPNLSFPREASIVRPDPTPNSQRQYHLGINQHNTLYYHHLSNALFEQVSQKLN